MRRLEIVPALAALAMLAASAPLHAQACSDWGQPGRELYADDFKGGLSQWVSEYSPAPGSAISAGRGKLVMDLAGDATVWFKPALPGDVRISYRRKVLMAGGANDRLSDMNQFWMSADPRNANLFTRDGTFSQYDGLRLYYAGVGGNSNTTTRFRKYEGNGERVLHTDHTAPPYLLEANREYAIQIDTYQGCTRLLVDGTEYFNFHDAAPLRGGHFGFRTTHSRQEVTDFKVQELAGAKR